jgi:hypothetical protein
MAAPPTPAEPKKRNHRPKVAESVEPTVPKKLGRPPKNRNGQHINGENRLFAL